MAFSTVATISARAAAWLGEVSLAISVSAIDVALDGA
jgi:hypothetical protein